MLATVVGCAALGCATAGSPGQPEGASGEASHSAPPLLPFDDEELPGAHLCCEGEVAENLMGCLGAGKLVASTGGANLCVARGARLLACGPDSGGWVCLPATDATPQLCACRGVGWALAPNLGMDDHTWRQRIAEVYEAHRSQDTEPEPLCCDEVDAETGTCRWSYSTGGPDDEGAEKTNEKTSAEKKQKGGLRLPQPFRRPLRGTISDDKRAECEADGAKVTTCPSRDRDCNVETTRDGSITTDTWVCTCATGPVAD